MYQPPKPSPKFANLSDAQLDASFDAAQEFAEFTRLALEKLQGELMRELELVGQLGEERVRRRLAKPGATHDWAWLLELLPFNSNTKYDATNALLKAGLPDDESDLIRLYGSTPDGKQHLIEIALLNGAPHLTAVVAGRLREVLPAMRLQQPTPLEPDEREYKRISLFEQSLSVRSSYYLAINEEAGMYQVRGCTSGSVAILEQCDSLDSLLKVAEDKYYYRKHKP